MRLLFPALILFAVLLARPASAQNAELCEGLLDELLIAVDRANASHERGDAPNATETFFWVEEAAAALELSCVDFLPADVLAWLADTRLSALVQVRLWDLAIDEADRCAERYGEQGYCWLRGAQAMQALDRPSGVERFLSGYVENARDELPAVFDDIRTQLERWVNQRGGQSATVMGTIGQSDQFLLQRLLNAGGFDPGPPDGVVGPQTLEALARFYQQTDSNAPQEPLTLLSFSKVLFDFEPLLQDEPGVVAALEPARAEIEPFFEEPVLARAGSGILIGREGRVLTALSLVRSCERIEVQADLPDQVAFPASARVIVTDGERDLAVLSTGLRTGYWARFPPGEEALQLAEAIEDKYGDSNDEASEADGDASGGFLISGYPLYGPLHRSFAVRYAGPSLEQLSDGLQQEWLGAPVTNAQGHLIALVTSGQAAPLSGDVNLQQAEDLAEVLLQDALEVTRGKPEDPTLSPSDEARLNQLMSVKVSCYQD